MIDALRNPYNFRRMQLALQLDYFWTSESMVYHDSDEVMDDWFVDREHA